MSAVSGSVLNAQRRYMMQRAMMLSNEKQQSDTVSAETQQIAAPALAQQGDENDNFNTPVALGAPFQSLEQDEWRLDPEQEDDKTKNFATHEDEQQSIESEYERRWREQSQRRYATRFADRQAQIAEQEEKNRQAEIMWKYTREQYAKIDRILASYGLERVPMAADGNCLFHSFASYFNSKDTDHRFIRQKICDFIDQNRDKFKIDIECDWPSVDAYLKAMRRVGEWGDGIILSAFCLAYNINVLLITPDGSSEMYPGENRSKIALVCYAKHYAATRVLNGKEMRL